MAHRTDSCYKMFIAHPLPLPQSKHLPTLIKSVIDEEREKVLDKP